jgi:GNAT superfamily N-acetyltransferase
VRAAMPSFEIRHAETAEDIGRIFPVMRELRPQLKNVDDFIDRARRQHSQGYRLIYVEDETGTPVACSGYRRIEYLFAGPSLYVDDLICLEAFRGKGYAEALMRWMEAYAREQGCETFHLDSGTQRVRAHHFYFRLGLSITSFHFLKRL